MNNNCLCGSVNYTKLFDGSFKEGTNQGHINYSIVRCNDCGISRTFPNPINHNNRYENAQNIEGIVKTERVTNKNIFNLLASDVLSFLDKNKINSGSLLDIGSGSGVLLSLATQRGFNVKGIELSEGLASYCHTIDLDVLNNDLTDVNFESNSFDVITMSQVLEHINNPINILQEINRILKPGGYLIISVPNYDNLIFKIKKSKYLPLQPECHFWHYSLETLTKLLIDNHFFVVNNFISTRNYNYTKLLAILLFEDIEVTYESRIANLFLGVYNILNNLTKTKMRIGVVFIIKKIFTLLSRFKFIGDNLIIVVKKK